MNILPKSEEAFVRVNQPQPDQFPRFYLIPETGYVRRKRRASNNPLYHQSQPTRSTSPQETAFRKYVRIEMEVFQEACADAWTAIKDLGRAVTQWIARWVIMRLAILSSLYVPAIHPMDLPI
jgi:hypothetical protein